MAMNWDLLKQLYLKNNQASQLYSLALNLARIQTLAHNGVDSAAAKHLVRESQFFIEWTVPTISLEVEIDFATELVDLQRLLSRWKLHWEEQWDNESKRLTIVQELQPWCDLLQNRYECLTRTAS